ncbi:MAG: chromosome segregation protein SMC [Ardenticatenales bacterium]|nr:chromosome segregation protein SMC [Ardenticatenales bacterium]
MRLKRLQLQGYKTFASKQEFVFDEGITAIVGPNGSGKSNVADALRWVLGEQSYSALRGKKTTDMIFAGSQSRARAGMAQAILTLDNDDAWLPIDYTEVEIGRRAYRSGENDYLINGQKVRLRDVADLLATSGLAERNYTIIGQGLIDRALSLRAEERRALFEEAAGINHYKSRRAETLRRLQETQHNLERVYDILSEIRPRLGSLKRQANRAQNYEQVAADLHHLLRQQYGYRWQHARLEMRRRRQEARDAESTWRDGRHKLQQHQDRLDNEKQQIAGWQRQEQDIQGQRDATRDRLEKTRRQSAILQERHSAIQRQLNDIAAEIPITQERLTHAEAELAVALAELETAQAQLAAQQTQMSQFNSSFQARQTEIRRWQKANDQANAAHRAGQDTLAQLKGQLTQLRERSREKPSETIDDAQLEAAAADIQRREAQVAQVQSQAAELQQSSQEKQRERRGLTQTLKEMRRANQQLAQTINAQQKELARLEARTELLAQMRQKEVRINNKATLIGRLAGVLTIPAPYQIALEAALQARLSTLIVADAASLWALLEKQDQPLSVVAQPDVLASPSPPRPQQVGVLGWAGELVACPPHLAGVSQLLLGRLLLVQDAATAYAVGRELPPGCLAASLDGLVVHAGGLVEQAPKDPRRSVLAQEAAWRAAVADLDAQRAETARLAVQADKQDQATQEQQAVADALERTERQFERERQALNQRLTKMQSSLERARQQLRFLQRQRENAARDQERLHTRIDEMQQAVINQEAEVTRLAQEADAAQAHLTALPIAELKQEQQNWQQKMEALRTIMAGRQAVVDSRRAALQQAQDLLRRQESRRDSWQQELAQLDLREVATELDTQQADLARLNGLLTPVQQKLRGGQEALRQLEREYASLQKLAHEQETRHTQTQIALSQHENHVEGLKDRIKSDLGLVVLPYDEDEVSQSPLPLSEIVEYLPVVEELPPDLEEEIQKYRGQLRRIGAINPDAPAEYEETQQRYDFLTQQVDDLTKTEQQLRQIVAELDELTSAAFGETVRQVDAIFGHMFKQLFGGGSASLVLTDPDDLTVSGVDIVARLPSRREQGLGLLSGGERSLTAVALIFALLKVAPTPFCVLDEVDAMLDEANVNRFVSALRELSARTQFIVITHNRGTVQAAQTVYGISMGSDSASRVISVRPEEYLHGAR